MNNGVNLGFLKSFCKENEVYFKILQNVDITVTDKVISTHNSITLCMWNNPKSKYSYTSYSRCKLNKGEAITKDFLDKMLKKLRNEDI